MSIAPFVDGDPADPDGAWLVAYTPAGQRAYIARIVVDPQGLNDPMAVVDDRLADMDPDLDTLTTRLAAIWETDPAFWPAGCRFWTIPTEALRFHYEARRAMADVIHQADKGTGLDASPSWVRDRYMILAEAALRHAADEVGVAVIEPVHAGWWDGTIAVAADVDCGPPRGYEPLYRVVATHEPNPTDQAYG